MTTTNTTTKRFSTLLIDLDKIEYPALPEPIQGQMDAITSLGGSPQPLVVLELGYNHYELVWGAQVLANYLAIAEATDWEQFELVDAYVIHSLEEREMVEALLLGEPVEEPDEDDFFTPAEFGDYDDEEFFPDLPYLNESVKSAEYKAALQYKEWVEHRYLR